MSEKKNPKADDQKVGDKPPPPVKEAEAKAREKKSFQGQGTEKKG
jgi:hypothetical protein